MASGYVSSLTSVLTAVLTNYAGYKPDLLEDEVGEGRVQ